MKATRALLIAGALVAALPAMAQPMPPYSPWYLGAGIGQGHLSLNGTDLTGFSNANVDRNETTYTIRAGWRFSPYAAIEAGYYDLGKYNFHGDTTGGVAAVDGQAKVKSAGASLVGILPLNQLDLYGRIGWVRSEIKVNASAPSAPEPANVKDHQNEATYGVGGRWNFMPQWGVFAEWMKNDKVKIDSYLVGVDFRF